MTTDTTAPRKSHALAWIITTLIAIPVLYVLSIGPVGAYAYKALKKGTISAEAFDSIAGFYRPLLYVAKKSPRIELALTDYLQWWYEITGTKP